MSKIFDALNIYGWSQENENLLLSTLVTADRPLIIGEPGSAKTQLAWKVAKALDEGKGEGEPVIKFAPFNISATPFEDLLGFPDPKAQAGGKMAYIELPTTIWGKNFVSLEEVNRPRPGVVNKILEYLRSGTINGMPTGARWVWSNMNPMSSSGTNKLSEAFVDRYSLFIYAPEALDMSPEERALIAGTISADDAPALNYWLTRAKFNEDVIARHTDTTDYKAAGKMLSSMLEKAIAFYVKLGEDLKGVDPFISIFAQSLYENMEKVKDDQTPEPVELSGRRIGYLHRAILANRAIELAMNAEFGTHAPPLQVSVSRVVQASIPYAVNEEKPPHDSMRTFIGQAVQGSFHRILENDDSKAELQYRLFCSGDPVERVDILLSGKIENPAIIITGWQRLASMNKRSSDMLAYIALQIDGKRRASGKGQLLPDNVLDVMKDRVKDRHVTPELPRLPPHLMAHVTELNEVIGKLTTSDPIKGLIAVEATHAFVAEQPNSDYNRLERDIKLRCQEYDDILQKAELVSAPQGV